MTFILRGVSVVCSPKRFDNASSLPCLKIASLPRAVRTTFSAWANGIDSASSKCSSFFATRNSCATRTTFSAVGSSNGSWSGSPFAIFVFRLLIFAIRLTFCLDAPSGFDCRNSRHLAISWRSSKSLRPAAATSGSQHRHSRDKGSSNTSAAFCSHGLSHCPAPSWPTMTSPRW